MSDTAVDTDADLRALRRDLHRHPEPAWCEFYTTARIVDELRARDVDLQVINQWNWHCGSFEGIHITDDGTLHACGDPRRASRAEGF